MKSFQLLALIILPIILLIDNSSSHPAYVRRDVFNEVEPLEPYDPEEEFRKTSTEGNEIPFFAAHIFEKKVGNDEYKNEGDLADSTNREIEKHNEFDDPFKGRLGFDSIDSLPVPEDGRILISRILNNKYGITNSKLIDSIPEERILNSRIINSENRIINSKLIDSIPEERILNSRIINNENRIINSKLIDENRIMNSKLDFGLSNLVIKHQNPPEMKIHLKFETDSPKTEKESVNSAKENVNSKIVIDEKEPHNSQKIKEYLDMIRYMNDETASLLKIEKLKHINSQSKEMANLLSKNHAETSTLGSTTEITTGNSIPTTLSNDKTKVGTLKEVNSKMPELTTPKSKFFGIMNLINPFAHKNPETTKSPESENYIRTEKTSYDTTVETKDDTTTFTPRLANEPKGKLFSLRKSTKKFYLKTF